MCSSTRVVPLGLTVYRYVTLTIKKKPHVRAWQEVVNLRIYVTEW